jgi:hypothetical protein
MRYWIRFPKGAGFLFPAYREGAGKPIPSYNKGLPGGDTEICSLPASGMEPSIPLTNQWLLWDENNGIRNAGKADAASLTAGTASPDLP